MPLDPSYLTQGGGTVGKTGVKPFVVIRHQTWTNPTTISTEKFGASHLGAAAAGTTSMTLAATNNDYARNVVITVTHASSIVAMSGVITGTDIGGATITEAWAVTATGTTKTFTGAKAFKTITSITEVVAADASGNTIIAGDGKVLGLDTPSLAAGTNACVKEIQSGTGVVTNGVYVAASTASTADARGTFTPNGTLNATIDWDVWYLSDYPGY
jgi:hypothetical protein